MLHAPYLHRRGSRYYYRRRVPKHLQPILGVSEFVQSLKTGSETEVLDKYLSVHRRVEQVIGTTAIPTVDPGSLYQALEVYLAENRYRYPEEGGEWHRFVRYRRSTIADFHRVVGQRPVTAITRAHVRRYRDWVLGKGNTPNTARKGIATLKAIIDSGFREWGVDQRNPFSDHRICDPTPGRDKRLPYTREEVRLILANTHRLNPQLSDIVTLMAFTGASPKEICLLVRDDFNLAVGCLCIRPNSLRTRLKAQVRQRAIPLVGPAVGIAEKLATQGDDVVFPRYGSYDTASTTANKWLREGLGLEDPRKSLYSLRHYVKQRLVEVGAPESAVRQVMGHASRDSHDDYGSGYSVVQLNEWMNEALVIRQ